MKRVIAEMGGKDFILIDETYDNLDWAAEQVVAGAFGFQGQKCSACSRLIVAESQYDELIPKIIEKTKAIKMGDVTDNKNWLGAVSSKSAFEKICSYIEVGKIEGELLIGGNSNNETGYYIEPTIFLVNSKDAKIFQEEIFGKVLAIIKTKTYEEGVELANCTEYGLTGALFSRDEKRLKDANLDLHCGNLYLNKKCTGALVDVHPFGGFNMSGTDSKAGSRDYLLLFMQGKSVSRMIGK